ncbi:hypothetical protein [Cellvibrio sp.]|uniref:hypothetical protein n=1 Tax=Cellvibrio sp. TaxID=1965322 RepID=UPI00396485C5
MSILSNRLALLIVVVASILALALYKMSVPADFSPVITEKLNSNTKTVAPAFAPSVPNSVAAKVEKKPLRDSYVALSPAETSELKNWVAERGYFSKEDETTYKAYSDQILEDLGKQGDIKALTVLTSRMVQSGNIEAAIRYANMNVVLGSTTALDTLTLFTVPSVYEENEAKIRSATLETLALAQVMNLRGDRTLANVSMRDTASSYKRNYNTDLQLTDAEQQFVEKRGQDLYDAYQQIRREKGLGDFDNENPSTIKKFFEGVLGSK